MGSFFTNVQVHTGGRDPGGVRGQVLAILRRCILAGPYEEVADPGDADRVIAVGPAGDYPWVSVFDDAFESLEESKLLELGAQLSKELDTQLVAISVYDSDVLTLHLMASGGLVDVFCNAPEYFEAVAREERARVAGNPFLWGPLLIEGATPSELNAVWYSDPVFVDDMVGAMAPMVGWHPELCRAGFEDLDELVEGATYLCFREKRAIRTHEAGRAIGPACLQPLELEPDREYPAGQAFELKLSGQNTGGSAKGLAVVLYGPALDEGLFVPKEVHARIGVGTGGQKSVTIEQRGAMARETAEGGEILWVARFPDFPIRAGVQPQLALVGGAGRRVVQDLANAWMESQVSVTVRGEADKPGEARCFAGMMPEGNETGGFVVGLQVRVAPAT